MGRDKTKNKETNRAKIRLAIVDTDNTFEKVSYLGGLVWQGKCIFCNKKLLINEDGSLVNHATIEHIIPKSQGGSDEIKNLALACKQCNTEKGIRHDRKKSNKQRAAEVIKNLQIKREKRFKKQRGN